MQHLFLVEEAHKDLRLDIYLALVLPNSPSRSFVQKLMREQLVSVNGSQVKQNYKVQPNDKISVNVDESLLPSSDLAPVNIALDIFYEDQDIVIINKPIGLTVHPATANATSTLANALVYHFQELSDYNGAERPGIVHRLDKDTSGLIVIAKTNTAHARLGKQFEKHTVVKQYVARVAGIVQYDQGVIDEPIGQHAKYHDQRIIAKKGEGREAVTVYEVTKRFKNTTLVTLFPQTGRTHQLRLHMKHLGHPILGDDRYGRKDSFPRLALHAQRIGFIHPTLKEYMEFCCPTPKEFLEDN